MTSTILQELNTIQEIMIYSDRCTPKELQKLDEMFEKELEKSVRVRYRKLNIWQFLKDENSQKKDEEMEVTAPTGESHENIVS